MVAVPSRSGRDRPFCANTPIPLKVSPSPQGRVGTGCYFKERSLLCGVAVPSRSGRDFLQLREQERERNLAVPSRSGRDGSCVNFGDLNRAVAVPSRSGRNLLLRKVSEVVSDSPSPQGRVGTGGVVDEALPSRKQSPSPQGRVKLGCGLSVES